MTADRWALIKSVFQALVDRAPSERAARLAAACGADADLRAAVDRLLVAHDSAGVFLETPCPVDPQLLEGLPDAGVVPPAQVGPYRVIRELGRGGMGTVYLAERDDADLKRTVAIKVVNVASQSIVARFRTETDVLASLEHPGIARLYDAGTTAAGVPYLVMEFVSGSDVLRYSDAAHAPIRDRLALFQRVCEAVQYAHQNFIVHRDLKPSNILVTDGGDPKLLDFGIAKLLSDDDAADATALFGAMLTPQYSSPEQIRGERVTTASDVYSLGVILYELLCGSRPYHIATRTPSEIERTISEQEPKAPSAAVGEADAHAATARGLDPDRLRRQLRGDLDNIVLKAMRKDPAERYPTAADLAADVERYLGGYPVTARSGSRVYRARKFLRRHRAPAAAISLATLALVAGLAIALWQAHAARVERDRADRRFRDVQRLANALIFKIHDGVQNLPNSTPVRRMIVAEALTYLETLRNDPAADESLRIELSQAYQRIGIVQGQGTVANLGDRRGAIDSFTKGLDVLRPLIADPVAHQAAAIQYGRTALELSTTEVAAGDKTRAGAIVREAEALAAKLAAAPNASDQAKRLLGSVHFQFAILTSGDESLAHWQAARDIFEALLAAKPDDPDRQRNVALVHKYLGSIYTDRADFDRALVHHARARDLDAGRLARDPSSRLTRLDVAMDLANTGRVLAHTNRGAEAIIEYEKSLAIRQQLADSDAHDVFAQSRVAFVHTRLSDLYGGTGDVQKSLEHARLAVSLIEPISRLDGTHRSDLADALLYLGEAERRAGNAADACRRFHAARTIFDELKIQSLTGAQAEDRRHYERQLAGDLAACSP